MGFHRYHKKKVKEMAHFRNKNKRQTNITGVVTVTEKDCHGNAEKMVRRFIKKVRNEGIVEEFRERSRYKKPSEVNAERKRERRRAIEKANKQQRELFTTRKTTNRFSRQSKNNRRS